MARFQQYYWGYQMDYPDDWVHATHGDIEAFAMHQEALDSAYEGPHMGYLLIRPEFNPYQKPIEPLLGAHFAKIGIMHAAKKIGSAPLKIGVLQGFETEMQLPQQVNRRLWVSVLAAGSIVLHIMVTHRRTEKDIFQPIVSRMVASLRFAQRVPDVETSPGGMPLPRAATPADIAEVYPAYEKESRWEAYLCPVAAEALQIFYLREAPVHKWKTLAFSPLPNREAEIQSATLVVHKQGQGAGIHIIPQGENRAALAIQYVKRSK